MGLLRWFRHLVMSHWQARRCFSAPVRAEIAAEIARAEALHAGEICFAVEAWLDARHLWHGCTPRQRALEQFAALGVWNTAANNGVLIYVLLADRSVEIVADRAISEHIGTEEWARLCAVVQEHYRARRFAEGSSAAVRGVAQLLGRHFPPLDAPRRNELPDQPYLL